MVDAAAQWSWLSPSISVASFVLSVTALTISVRDRRPHLVVRPRKGDWAKFVVTHTDKDVMFKGVVEIYNRSSRANAIRDYAFWCKRETRWEPMESERFKNIHQRQRDQFGEIKEKVSNVTPLALAPYSGIEAEVMAFTGLPPAHEIMIRIEVEDIFGKRYRTEVLANDHRP